MPTEDAFKLRRLCPCKTSRRRQLASRPPRSLPPREGATIDGVEEIGIECPHAASRRRLRDANAARSRGGVAQLAASLALGALASLSGAPRRTVLFLPIALLAASQLPRAAAHNWIFNPSTRVTGAKASTTRPCRARRTNIPDVHVNPGQEFEAEWSTGHGNDDNGGGNYFTVVKADDEEMLLLVSKPLLDDYIDSAPASKHWMPHAHWEKRHLSWNSTQNGNGAAPKGGTDNVNHENEGKVLMSPLSDLHYIKRSVAAKCGVVGHPYRAPTSGDDCIEVSGGMQQWTYTTAAAATDANVAYTNPKYPWIISAHRFALEGGWTQQADIARFKIDQPPGEYVLHWSWSGYYDCIDVAVLPNDGSTVVPETSSARCT